MAAARAANCPSVQEICPWTAPAASAASPPRASCPRRARRRRRESSRAIRNLGALGAFRPTPYKGVLIGAVGGDPKAAVLELWQRERQAFERVVRVIPLERVARFEREDVTGRLGAELLPDLGLDVPGRE